MPAPAVPAHAAFQPNKAWMRALEATARIGREPGRTLPHVIEACAARFAERPALIATDHSLTHAELAALVRRQARWALAQELRPGETVAVLMPNAPLYVALWLGLARVGCVAALLNTNLVGASLAHCIAVVRPQHVIVAASLLPALEEAMPHRASRPRIWVNGGTGRAAGHNRLDLAAFSDAPLAAHEERPVTLRDRALCIYTSGTTGLPKAANVSHHRLMMWSHWFAGLIGTTPEDRLYNCLPMYHSVGGVVATGSVLVHGGAVVVREKFSASRFWDEVAGFECTLFQYIGEICRYLLQAPPVAAERRHGLRLICGNGLRADVWTAFQERFRIPHVLEFYAATEANFSLYNVAGKVGAIGQVPAFLAPRFNAAIVRHDPETGLPARGPDGLCIAAGPDEVGEALSRIDAADLAARFEGYTDEADTAKKIVRDVFAPGDAWFRTGDLMRRDAKNFWYFVDRIGDTFRWKGENVATSEVAAVLEAAPGVLEASVYGVIVPGAEGRAGMAALVTDAAFAVDSLYDHVAARLPAYARPLFLRLSRRLAMTETFKPKKGELIREGFDPGQVTDPLYVADHGRAAFVPLDAERFAAIRSGAVRL